jgi:hypothetical protein
MMRDIQASLLGDTSRELAFPVNNWPQLENPVARIFTKNAAPSVDLFKP